MSFAIFQSLCENLSKSGVARTDGVLFVSQLLAWAYLSEQYPEQVHPNFPQKTQGLSKKKLVGLLSQLCELSISREAAEELKLIDSDARKHQVMMKQASKPRVLRFNLSFVDQVSEETLVSLIAMIAEAMSAKLISFEDIPLLLHRELGKSDQLGSLFFPAEDLMQLMVYLAAIRPEDSVYCPHSSSFRAALVASSHSKHVYAELMARAGTGQHFLPLDLVNLFYGSKVQIERARTAAIPAYTLDGKLREFDVTLSAPPSSQKMSPIDDYFGVGLPTRRAVSEVVYLRQALAQTIRRAVFWIPLGILFRNTAEEKVLRKELVDSRSIEMVVLLPEGLLQFSAIPSVFLVIDKSKHHDSILFVDTSNEGSLNKDKAFCGLQQIEMLITGESSPSHSRAEVSIETIVENDYLLTPNRYLVDDRLQRLTQSIESMEGPLLGDVAEIIRVQALKAKSDEQKVSLYREARTTDISDEGVIEEVTAHAVHVPERLQKRAESCRLRAGDVLLSVKGTIGKVGLVTNIPIEPTVPAQSFVIIRLKHIYPIDSAAPDRSGLHISREFDRPISPLALYRYLASPMVQAWLNSRSSGAGVQFLSSKEIKGLRLPMLGSDLEEKVREVHLKLSDILERIELLEEQKEEIYSSLWPA